MNPLTSEWVAKAEGDWAVVGQLLRVRKAPNYDATCFHAQQCAEKYLKARLEEAGLVLTRTHDLARLLHDALLLEPGWSSLRPSLNKLTDYAVDFRYPGHSATRDTVRPALGLPP